MSLVSFHRLLIVTAILFCGGFAAWQLDRYAGSGDAVELVVGSAFALGAVLLIVYLVRLNRILGRREPGS